VIGAASLAAVAGHVEAVLADEPPAAVPAALSTTRGTICGAAGLLRAAARDTALKITESTSVLAAAYSPRELRDGWAAALAPGLTVLCFGGDRDDPGLAAFGAEAARRGAVCFGLSPRPDAAVRLPAGLPDWVLPIAAVVRGQQLARGAALLAGRDPDQPAGPGERP
jgi:glucosamine--fructose-6-phosphate aminotransferase (isomerizing)